MLRQSGIVAGKLAFVTGAGSGIGRAACQILSREGATVIAADKNLSSCQDTIKSFVAPSAGDEDHSSLCLDVDHISSVNCAIEEVFRKYKRPPTVIVNSAGIVRDNWLIKLSEIDFDDVIRVNLKGTFLVMQAFSKAMIDGKVESGSIVNIASIVGKVGNLGQVNYSASKAGVEGMTKSAAKELGKNNIRVNAVLPGFIDTPMIKTVPDKVKAMIESSTPLRRVGRTSEVAEVIAFLSSDRSSFVTGTSIEVTGGFSN